jgi:hypothetical protein
MRRQKRERGRFNSFQAKQCNKNEVETATSSMWTNATRAHISTQNVRVAYHEELLDLRLAKGSVTLGCGCGVVLVEPTSVDATCDMHGSMDDGM